MPIWTGKHWENKEAGTDFVVCLICGHQARKLDYHIKEIHGMSAVDYRFQCGRYALLECRDYAQQREARRARKAQRTEAQTGHITCPVCALPLKNRDGITHHMQHRCKQKSPEHLAWRAQQEAIPANRKTCRLCAVEKPLEKFGKAPSCRDGHRLTCSACLADKNKRTNSARLWEERTKYRRKPEVKAKQRDARLQKTYGITLDEYRKRLADQDGKCAICGTHDNGLTRWGTPANFHVDHDHMTGRIRGLLCFPCNKGVGMFRDDPTRLEHAANYLKQQPAG